MIVDVVVDRAVRICSWVSNFELLECTPLSSLREFPWCVSFVVSWVVGIQLLCKCWGSFLVCSCSRVLLERRCASFRLGYSGSLSSETTMSYSLLVVLGFLAF